jgi:hypothetical protein
VILAGGGLGLLLKIVRERAPLCRVSGKQGLVEVEESS